eukprot:gene6826-3692_t
MLSLALLFGSGVFCSGQAPDPVAPGDAIVSFGEARFTVLSPSLIRLEHSARRPGSGPVGDDRATSVVINRKMAVPDFQTAHLNATAITITTSKLRLTYNLNQPPAGSRTISAELGRRQSVDACGCTGAACTQGNTTWEVHPKTQGGDGTRTPSCPNGLLNQTLESCFCACMADQDCTAITFAPANEDLGAQPYA